MNSKPVKVVFNITATYPENTKVNPDKVWLSDPDTLTTDTANLPTLVDGQELLPKLSGYQLKMEKSGYLPASTILKFPPSELPYEFVYKLVAVPRKLVFEIDSDYKLGSIMALEEVKNFIYVDTSVYNHEDMYAPGNRTINIQKPGYQPDSFEHTLPTGDGAYSIRRTLTALPRQVMVRVDSEFTKQEMVPETCTIGNRRPDEGTYKPAEYELNIGHPGYLSIVKNLSIEPGEGVLELNYTLIPKNRKIRPVITYDRTPRKDSPEPTVKLKNVDTAEEFKLSKELDEVKAAEYYAIIEKDGYEIGQKVYAIEPGDKPYDLAFEMESKPVELLIEISYDIPPPANIPPYTVSFIDDVTKASRAVSHGKRIKPGEYTLDLKRPGYLAVNNMQKITVLPGTQPHWIKEKMMAQSRTFSFSITFDTLMIRAVEVLVDNQKVEANNAFQPGREYLVVAKFKDYKTSQNKVHLPPGEGPFVAKMELTKLQKFEFKIAKKYFENKGMLLDNIRYNLEIYSDQEFVEPHHIIEDTEATGLARGEFYAPKETNRIRMMAGFYRHDVDAMTDTELDFRDLSKIEASFLLNHLKNLTPDKAIKRMTALLGDKTDKAKIAKMTRDDKDSIKDYLQSLNVTDPGLKQERDAVTRQL